MDLSKYLPRMIQDFEIFTQYLAEEKVYLSHSSLTLKNKDLYEINGRLTKPEENRTPKLPQRAYPLLDLFYRISREGELFATEGPPTRLALVPTERYKEYGNLSKEEKYLSLLENFWVNLDWKRFQQIYRTTTAYEGLTSFLVYSSSCQFNHPILVESSPLEELIQEVAAPLKYLSYFGFWDLEEIGVIAKNRFAIVEIVPTRLGIYLSRVLWQHRDFFLWNRMIRNFFDHRSFIEHVLTLEVVAQHAMKNRPPSSFVEALTQKIEIQKEILDEKRGMQWPEEPFIQPFLPLFPTSAPTKILPPLGEIFKEGRYVLKVTLGRGLWRRIGLFHFHTLEDLSKIIQRTFAMNEDHLYAFFMDNKRWSNAAYYSSMCDEGPYDWEVKIGELNLKKGMRFLYLFDFGSEWHFTIIVEEIEDMDRIKKSSKPLLLASKGELPTLY